MKIFTIEKAWKLGHFIFLILLGMSVFYALERVCYMDSAFMFFRMVNGEKLIAEGGRYIHVIPQFLPWLMVKLNAPLHLIIISFSLMYTMCLYVTYIILGKLMNNKVIALVFLFLLLISVNETFFDVVTETKFSLAFACLFLAHLLREKQASIYVGILMLVFGFYTHPIFIVYCAFIIFFISLFKFNKRILFYGGFLLILLLSKAFIFGSTAYEKDLILATFYDPFQLLKNSFINTYFRGLLGTQFIVVICIIFLQLLSLVKSKKWLLLSLYSFAVLLLYIALALVYSKGDSHMMIQKTLLIFHFTLLIPFIMLEKTMSLWVQRSVYLLIILGCFWALWSTNTLAKKYTNRVAVLEHFLKKIPNQTDKYLLSENQIDHEVMMGTWALPHESMLVSKIKFKKAINLKNFRERNDTLFLSQFPNAFRPAFGLPLLNSELNTTYFEMDQSKLVLWLDSTYILGKN
jgi:hypothetical protein